MEAIDWQSFLTSFVALSPIILTMLGAILRVNAKLTQIEAVQMQLVKEVGQMMGERAASNALEAVHASRLAVIESDIRWIRETVSKLSESKG